MAPLQAINMVTQVAIIPGPYLQIPVDDDT